MEFPTRSSSKPPNLDFVKIFGDSELRDSSEIEAKAPHLAPVSALSARFEAPRSLRSSMSSRFSMTWSSARPRNLDFLHNSDDLELLEASETRFRRRCQGSGAPRRLRTSISSTVSTIGSSTTAQNLDFVDRCKDFELRGEAPITLKLPKLPTSSKSPNTLVPTYVDIHACM